MSIQVQFLLQVTFTLLFLVKYYLWKNCKSAASICQMPPKLWEKTQFLLFLLTKAKSLFKNYRQERFYRLYWLQKQLIFKKYYSEYVVLPYPQGLCSKTPKGQLKLQIVVNPIYVISFSLHRHTFTLKGSTLQLLSGTSALPASPLLCFGTVIQ